MGGKHSRSKGHNHERSTANQFVEHGWPDAKRNVTETQTGGQGIDLINTGIFDVQCKRYKQYAPITKIKEVPRKEGRIPVLVTKADREEEMAVLPFKDFLRLANAFEKKRLNIQ